VTWPFRTIGETSDNAPFVECVWASGLNVAIASSGGQYPATAAEREALREDGGGSDTAGANFGALALGWKVRYGHEASTSHAFGGSWEYITGELAASHYVAVAGWYASLPSSYRRWQSGSSFYHAIAVGPGPWMVDPLGPDGYGGQAITFTDLKNFCITNSYKALSGAGWETEVKFISAGSFPAITAKLLPAPKGTAVVGFDGSLLDTLVADSNLPTYGLLDGHTGQYIVEITTGKPYSDGKQRATRGLVKSTTATIPNPAYGAPAPPPTATKLEPGLYEVD
jgi:hypothetical protein